MEMTIRRGEGNIWGFVEVFKPYRFGDVGSVTVTLGVTTDGKFTVPYILRSGKFVPLQEVEGDVGLKAYMKAKKPTYSLLSDGFIITLKCYFNYVTGEFIREKSNYDIYSIIKTTPVNANESKLSTVRLLEIPSQLEDLSIELMKQVVKTGANREEFLKGRFSK